MQKFHAKLKIGCRASRDDCTSSHAAVGNCGSLDFRASQEKAAKSGPWSGHLTVSKVLGLFGLRHVGIDHKLSAGAASGRLRHEIHDLRIAVEPGAGSFLAAPVQIRIHHHVTPKDEKS